jgi:acetolactate synthase I/II/III large subunit
MTVLLVSGFGDDTGGGIFSLEDGRLEQVDRLSSTGLAVHDGQLARLLRSSAEGGHGCELLLYDTRGIKRYLRLDEVSDPHDVLFSENGFVVASTRANTVFWLSQSGEVVRHWKAPGEGDAWHLNSLALDGDRLIACAFGRFDSHRQWAFEDTRGHGFVFDLETGEEILGGLWCPHDPHKVDGGWVVCNSAGCELTEFNERGKVLRRLTLGGWTRGLAVDDDFFYVGQSASRKQEGAYGEAAAVVVVNRDTWRIEDQVTVPCREIYDLVLAPRELLDGVRAAFRTNPLRVAESDQADLFAEAGIPRPHRLWATGDPLPAEACLITIEATAPRSVPAGTVQELECFVENRGDAMLVSAPPNPVHLSYRWFPVEGAAPIEGLRSVLPEALPPSVRRSCRLSLEAPRDPGDYKLVITLVQEQVRWFDEVADGNALATRVLVT